MNVCVCECESAALVSIQRPGVVRMCVRVCECVCVCECESAALVWIQRRSVVRMLNGLEAFYGSFGNFTLTR